MTQYGQDSFTPAPPTRRPNTHGSSPTDSSTAVRASGGGVGGGGGGVRGAEAEATLRGWGDEFTLSRGEWSSPPKSGPGPAGDSRGEWSHPPHNQRQQQHQTPQPQYQPQQPHYQPPQQQYQPQQPQYQSQQPAGESAESADALDYRLKNLKAEFATLYDTMLGEEEEAEPEQHQQDQQQQQQVWPVWSPDQTMTCPYGALTKRMSVVICGPYGHLTRRRHCPYGHLTERMSGPSSSSSSGSSSGINNSNMVHRHTKCSTTNNSRWRLQITPATSFSKKEISFLE